MSRWLALISRTVLISGLIVSRTAGETRLDHQQPSKSGCVVKPVDFKGWKGHELSNSWVTLVVVPQLGGRLMQVTFDNHDYLFVNEQLKGQYFPPQTSATQRKWFNYGGDKIWPMPEGEDDEQHWASAAGSVLDGGEFSFEVISKSPTCAVRMISPPDPQTGLQYTREIAIGGHTPEIRFSAIMKNITGYPLRWSEQSVSQYNTADPKNPVEYNRDFWGFTPANSRSEFLNGYHVRTGQASNSAYAVRDGLFTVHVGDQGGEVWIDSRGPWVAVVDGATNYAMIERFHYDARAEYPGKSTVIFYTTGQRRPAAEGEPPRPPIHYIEAEINSPMIELEPGESYNMRTEWFPTRTVGGMLKDVTYAGVISTPLSATATAPATSATQREVVLSGQFGVVFAGKLVARFYDRGGLALESVQVAEVNPRQPVLLQTTVRAPAETARVSLHLVDQQGLDRGPLGEVKVMQSATPPP